jgi:hypothetical protein
MQYTCSPHSNNEGVNLWLDPDAEGLAPFFHAAPNAGTCHRVVRQYERRRKL